MTNINTFKRDQQALAEKSHVCRLGDPWPTGHPLPAIVPERLQGPLIGDTVVYHRVRRWGEGYPVVWHEEAEDLSAVVLQRSYVWSPGECRHNGGYRHYDWSVIKVTEPASERHPEGGTYTVVVDDTDLKEDPR